MIGLWGGQEIAVAEVFDRVDRAAEDILHGIVATRKAAKEITGAKIVFVEPRDESLGVGSRLVHQAVKVHS